MGRVFVDTSAWITLMDDRDPRQASIARWFQDARARFVTTSDVLDEAVTFACSRWGHGTAVKVGEGIRENHEVHFVHVEPEFLDAAWELFKRRRDKGYSLTDCTSFVVMERLGIKEVVTLDKHFAQEGFHVVPKS